MPILGIWASQISGHLWAPAGAYDALATVTVPSGGAASITFSGIPTGYKHLQLRMLARSTRVNAGDYVLMRFNSDLGSNYAYHVLNCDGSGAGASAGSTQNGQYWGRIGAGVIDILDYANTNKNKTSRGLIAYDNNGSGELYFNSGLWQSTSAISSVVLTCDSSFAQYSQFALFGVK